MVDEIRDNLERANAIIRGGIEDRPKRVQEDAEDFYTFLNLAINELERERNRIMQKREREKEIKRGKPKWELVDSESLPSNYIIHRYRNNDTGQIETYIYD